VKELEDVEPKFGLLGKRRAQWDLLSDRLRALGYDKKEIDALYKKLKGRKVTLEDTTTFSRRWKDKYGEDVPPQIIYDFLNNPDSGNADS
jgi:hypothetical protein